jgi:hypothetical protein
MIKTIVKISFFVVTWSFLVWAVYMTVLAVKRQNEETGMILCDGVPTPLHFKGHPVTNGPWVDFIDESGNHVKLSNCMAIIWMKPEKL